MVHTNKIMYRYYRKYCYTFYKIYLRDCNSVDIIEIDTFNELKAIDKTYDV